MFVHNYEAEIEPLSYVQFDDKKYSNIDIFDYRSIRRKFVG